MNKVTITIQYQQDFYDGDWLVVCNVTYLSVLGEAPYTIDYSEEAESPDDILASMATAITEYVSDPENFERAFVEASTERGRARRLLEADLKKAQNQRDLAAMQVSYADTTIARLKEQLKEYEK